MLRNTKDLEKDVISATDGLLGHVTDFYFDDLTWVIRYLMVETGTWRSSRKALISPIVMQQAKLPEPTMPTSIFGEHAKKSLTIDNPNGHRTIEQLRAHDDGVHRTVDSTLCSCRAVSGYHIQASDGEIGRVAGYLVDDEKWVIRYLIVDTSHWWAGDKVLVAPAWITGVNRSKEAVLVHLSRQSIKYAPVYDPEAVWSQDMDRNVYEHYGRTGPGSGSALPTSI